MNVDFELYKIFYTVANTKNITKAAKELCISQPAISKSIKNLEIKLVVNYSLEPNVEYP
ncbi:MAG: LysR family transcriptional regulator [Bacilli bacterium]